MCFGRICFVNLNGHNSRGERSATYWRNSKIIEFYNLKTFDFNLFKENHTIISCSKCSDNFLSVHVRLSVNSFLCLLLNGLPQTESCWDLNLKKQKAIDRNIYVSTKFRKSKDCHEKMLSTLMASSTLWHCWQSETGCHLSVTQPQNVPKREVWERAENFSHKCDMSNAMGEVSMGEIPLIAA